MIERSPTAAGSLNASLLEEAEALRQMKEAKRRLVAHIASWEQEAAMRALTELLGMEGANLEGSALDLPDAWAKEANEDTLVNICVTHAAAEPLKALLAAGANPQGKARPGESEPIHHITASSSARAIECAQALLDAGLSVNSQTSGGFTPLHGAAQRNRPEMAAFLLSRGANPDLARKDGARPEDLAREAGNAAVLEVLVAWREARELSQSIGGRWEGAWSPEPKARQPRGI